MANTELERVPPPGDDRRVWLRYQLQQIHNPATNRRYTQSDVAREAFISEGTLSLLFKGKRYNRGPRIAKAMRITARILGRTTDDLFGVWLEAGDGYPGSPGERPDASEA